MMKILWFKQHKFKVNFIGFPWHYTKFNLELLMANENVLSKFMDVSLHCNDPWNFMLTSWKSFHLERGGGGGGRRGKHAPWMKIYNYYKFILKHTPFLTRLNRVHRSFDFYSWLFPRPCPVVQFSVILSLEWWKVNVGRITNLLQ